MKFKKIDDYTVRCLLTEDDMIENNIEIEDFFNNREKVHSLMEVIMDKARAETGYEFSSDILSMQIMPLPKNGLAITISGKKEPDIDSLMEEVKNLRDMVKESIEDDTDSEDEYSDMLETLDNLGIFGPGGSNAQIYDDSRQKENDSRIMKADSESAKEDISADRRTSVEEKAEKEAKIRKDGVGIFRFRSFNEFESLCLAIKSPKYISSSLYKDESEKVYYLILEQGRLKATTFESVCLKATDYGTIIPGGRLGKYFIREHHECIIEKNAVSSVRRIASV